MTCFSLFSSNVSTLLFHQHFLSICKAKVNLITLIMMTFEGSCAVHFHSFASISNQIFCQFSCLFDKELQKSIFFHHIFNRFQIQMEFCVNLNLYFIKIIQVEIKNYLWPTHHFLVSSVSTRICKEELKVSDMNGYY